MPLSITVQPLPLALEIADRTSVSVVTSVGEREEEMVITLVEPLTAGMVLRMRRTEGLSSLH